MDKYQIKGHPNAFRLSDHPLAVDSIKTDMDNYTIRKWQEIDGHGDSRCFTAIIQYNGEDILFVENDGHGGSNFYGLTTPSTGEKSTKFYVDAKEWAKAMGYADCLEAEDIWCDWWYDLRPYGVTAEAYMTKWAKEMAELKNKMDG